MAMEVIEMSDQLANETTQHLPLPSLEARLGSLETGQAAIQATLNEVLVRLDVLTQLQHEILKMQREMYVDLRGRFTPLENELRQIKQDLQPDSFQNRLMRLGQ
jgi:BMFP domain-containing protein YqiC